MDEDKDFDYVFGKVPRHDKDGNDITGDNLGGGGYHREDGTFSGMAYDLEKVEKDDDDNDNADVLNNINAGSDAGANSDGAGLALAAIFLLLTGVAAGAGIIIGTVKGDQIKSFYNKIKKWGTKKILHKNVDDEANSEEIEDAQNLSSEQRLNQEYMGNMLLIKENVESVEFDIKQHADEYVDCYNKTAEYLSTLIKDYNDTSKESTLIFATLYSILIPFKQSFMTFTEAYKNVFKEQPSDYSEWNKTIAALNLEKFLDELRLFLDQEETKKKAVILQMPNNQLLDKDNVMRNLRLLLSEEVACA